ncbi:hypothetical protein M2375_003739 [Comamonas sp. BIGb0152]|nr:hypothetical protein [Comamonas sp. BIGb0152]
MSEWSLGAIFKKKLQRMRKTMQITGIYLMVCRDYQLSDISISIVGLKYDVCIQFTNNQFAINRID